MMSSNAVNLNQFAESDRFHVKDGVRNLTFTGVQLASADSQMGTQSRWTELTLYRTSSGKYVLETIGRSDVFHGANCRRGTKGIEFGCLDEAAEDRDEDGDKTLADIFVPCDECSPSYSIEPVWVERDISSCTVVDNASGVVDALYHAPDASGRRYMSRVARALLADAAREDDKIRLAVEAPTDVT